MASSPGHMIELMVTLGLGECKRLAVIEAISRPASFRVAKRLSPVDSIQQFTNLAGGSSVLQCRLMEGVTCGRHKSYLDTYSRRGHVLFEHETR